MRGTWKCSHNQQRKQMVWWVKEAIHVQLERPSMNRCGGLWHQLSAIYIYNAVLKSLPKLRSHLNRGDLSISHHGKVGQQVTTTWCQACLQSDSSSKLNSFDSPSAFRTADVFQMRNIFKNLKLKYLRLFLLDITILILKIKKDQTCIPLCNPPSPHHRLSGCIWHN